MLLNSVFTLYACQRDASGFVACFQWVFLFWQYVHFKDFSDFHQPRERCWINTVIDWLFLITNACHASKFWKMDDYESRFMLLAWLRFHHPYHCMILKDCSSKVRISPKVAQSEHTHSTKQINFYDILLLKNSPGDFNICINHLSNQRLMCSL